MAFPINPNEQAFVDVNYLQCQFPNTVIDLGIEAIVFENATLCVISLYSYW